MERVLKFRAWDTVRKSMTAFSLTDLRAECAQNTGLLIGGPHQHEKDEWEQFVIMQFTGLRDNKRTPEYLAGQPIYEGDIWREEDNHDDYEDATDLGISINFYVCTWVEEYTAFCWLTVEDWELYTTGTLEDEIDYYDSMEASQCSKYHIVGNIHENPELLK
jgi:uncharacterized phage protein (TIGR01671 family)